MNESNYRTELDPMSSRERLQFFPKNKLSELRKAWKDLHRPLKNCLFPGCSVENQNIMAHSISKRFLNRLADNNKVYIWNHNLGGKEITLVPCKKATTFPGVCSAHDQHFSLIDKQDIDISNPDKKYLFLLTYRALLKEIYIKEKLWEKIQNKKISADVRIWSQKSSLDNLRKYKEIIDKMYIDKDWNGIFTKIIPLRTAPTIAVSSLFSLDDDKPLALGQATVSVLPHNADTTICIFSATTNQKIALIEYLNRNICATKTREFLRRLSLTLLRDNENFVLSPKFWNRLPQYQQDLITNFVSKTLFQGSRVDINRVNENLTLFSNPTPDKDKHQDNH